MLAGLGLALAAFLLLPPKSRLPLLLTGLGPWVLLSCLPDLGLLQGITKVGMAPYFFLIAGAAAIHPAPTTRLPQAGILMLFGAALSFCYIWNLVDVFDALILRIQWLAMTCATLMLVRCMTDFKSFSQIVNSIFFGICISMFIPLSSLFIFGENSSFTDGRFTPYSIHPNFLGQVFIYGTPWAVYQGLKARFLFFRIFFLFAAGAGIFQTYITFSRGSLLCLFIPLTVALYHIIKKSRMAIPFILTLMVAILLQNFSSINKSQDRLFSLDSKRYEIFSSYNKIIRERPITGLMFSENESYMNSSDALMQPHNAYILVLYFGGVSYAFIYFTIIGISLVSCVHLLQHYRHLPDALPLLLIASLLATYVHGMVEIDIFRATSLFSFLNLFLSLTVIHMARNPKVLS